MLVTETFPFDGGRQVSAYVPERPIEAVVYCADGQLIVPWGADIEAEDFPSTLVVGAHRNRDETLRLHEYSPKFDPAAFGQHEEFFIGDLCAWAGSRFGLKVPRERTAVFGVSASGEFALAMGARHPDQFGAVFSASPGAGFRPSEDTISSMPPTYMVAGREEPFFLANARRWANSLRDNGVEVVMTERDAGHDDAMWRAEFPRMISWAFS
ncbi:esterase family protein [Pseudoruegeria sp. HB172150]|uniref:alpha/beta hydrolase n=1 Tax=Pseudoruegeria sp. HB172150 TaxID=2721164 RepID=UPI0015539917|nr:alpha/beta hydrolase-fold protein [Pseudoruegeria sp. HB172150]